MWRDYSCPKFKQFRKEVLKRDKYKCQWPQCKVKKRLQVHHINTWADNPWLRYYVGNGITLCKHHHDDIKGKEQYFAEYFLRIIKDV